MCGIVGYVGDSKSLEVLLGGLKRLEYRGYDSAGVAIIDADGHLESRKKAGKLQMLVDDLAAHPLRNGATGIGHTRWATHGGPTDRNAHPQLGDNGKLALIHNGIIENFFELKEELLADGAVFTSDTDSEVAALLVAFRARSGIPVLCNTSANCAGAGFFPDVRSACNWGKTNYVWSEGVLYTNPMKVSYDLAC